MNHVVSTNMRKNQVNNIFENSLKFDSNPTLDIPMRHPQPVVTISLIVVKNI